MGAQNLEATYKKLGIKAIFEGGEKHNAIGASFNAYCNYQEALARVTFASYPAIRRIVSLSVRDR